MKKLRDVRGSIRGYFNRKMMNDPPFLKLGRGDVFKNLGISARSPNLKNLKDNWKEMI